MYDKKDDLRCFIGLATSFLIIRQFDNAKKVMKIIDKILSDKNKIQ